MSLCNFWSFNYISSCVRKHTSQSQRKETPTILKLPLSGSRIPISNNKSSSDTNSSVGIIGGVSDSSLSFIDKLANSKLKDQESRISPSIILSSDPNTSNDLLSLAKTEISQLNHSSIVQNLRLKRVFLESYGVSCITMPCHISHSWYDEISEGCSVPFLNMGECVAKELKEEKLKPLGGGSYPRIGVLATNQTLKARHYQEKLEHEGFEVILPDKATIEHIVIPAVEALSRDDYEGAQNLFRIALQVLLVRAVNKVIVAADELHLFLPPNDPLWKKCIDPLDALARSCLDHACSTQRGT